MLHPSYTELTDILNDEAASGEGEHPIISSRYSVVMASAKRARQIVGGHEPLVKAKAIKPLSIAIEEIYRGQTTIMTKGSLEE